MLVGLTRPHCIFLVLILFSQIMLIMFSSCWIETIISFQVISLFISKLNLRLPPTCFCRETLHWSCLEVFVKQKLDWFSNGRAQFLTRPEFQSNFSPAVAIRFFSFISPYYSSSKFSLITIVNKLCLVVIDVGRSSVCLENNHNSTNPATYKLLLKQSRQRWQLNKLLNCLEWLDKVFWIKTEAAVFCCHCCRC